MMKFFFLSFFYLALTGSLFGEKLDVSLSSEYAILMNAKTGQILYAKNAHVQAYPASITKIATALLALKLYGERLDEFVTVKQEAVASISPQAKKQSNYRSPAYWLETDGSHVGIKKGEELQLRHLLYAMLVASANDAANVIAGHVGSTIPKFIERLNSHLKEIGCKNTHFCNPHGLHHPEHMTTAYDMALIAKAAMRHPFFREVVSTVNYTIPKTNLEQERKLTQFNLLLRHGNFFYSKAIGIKTGTTAKAGGTLVAAAKDNERELIAVVMGNFEKGGRYEDVTRLFEAAFKQKKLRRYLLPKGLQSLTTTIKGAKAPLKTFIAEGLYYDFYPAEEKPVKTSINWTLSALPIKKDDVVAHVKVSDDQGNVIQTAKLLSAEKVEANLFYKIKNGCLKDKRSRRILFFTFASFFLVWFFINIRKKKYRTR